MINKVLENQNLLKLLFSFSILLIFLDSYQVLNTPLSWVGNLLLTLICLIIFRKEKMKFNLLFFIIVFVTLLPTIFSLFTMTYNFVNLNPKYPHHSMGKLLCYLVRFHHLTQFHHHNKFPQYQER